MLKKTNRILLHLGILICIGSHSTAAAGQDKFKLKCDPFPEGTSEKHKVDKVCNVNGSIDTSLSAELRDAKKLQANLKNELCRAANNAIPKTITLSEILDLQLKAKAAHVPYGGTHGNTQSLPTDRSVLSNLEGTTFKEGDYVQFIGYLIDPHYSPKGESAKVESVNCHGYGHDFADIHINLSEKPLHIEDLENADKQQELCALGSAEVIPHYRPEILEKQHLDELQGKIVRVRGQLMFDAEHYPCHKEGHSSQWVVSSPARMSLWEIHPIYTIDVCNSKKKAECKPEKNSMWVDLAAWLEQNSPDEDAE
jgi:hypothetical protein